MREETKLAADETIKCLPDSKRSKKSKEQKESSDDEPDIDSLSLLERLERIEEDYEQNPFPLNEKLLVEEYRPLLNNFLDINKSGDVNGVRERERYKYYIIQNFQS